VDPRKLLISRKGTDHQTVPIPRSFLKNYLSQEVFVDPRRNCWSTWRASYPEIADKYRKNRSPRKKEELTPWKNYRCPPY